MDLLCLNCNKLPNFTLLLCFSELMLFDFSSEGTIGWIEQSDTVRSVGKSKASLVPFQNKYDKWAVLFTMLNPQENGAGFAGYRIKTDLDLSDYSAFALKVRGQGKNSHYKLVLRHRGQNDEPFPSYEQTFKVDYFDMFCNKHILIFLNFRLR